MRYQWVSQNQTGNPEISGGYMWCRKTNRDGSRNPYYEMLLRVDPGDIVFSFRGQTIANIGVVFTEAFEARKPNDFGARGAGWLDIGWMVLVEYEPVRRPFQPAMHMGQLQPILPKKYSPLLNAGTGKQFYYTTLTHDLGRKLLELADYD